MKISFNENLYLQLSFSITLISPHSSMSSSGIYEFPFQLLGTEEFCRSKINAYGKSLPGIIIQIIKPLQATSWNGVNCYHLSLREKKKNALLYVLLSQLGNVYQLWSVACLISRCIKVMHQCQKQVVMEWQWKYISLSNFLISWRT